MKREREWAIFFDAGSRPGSEGYIQDKYTMHKAKLGQEYNKRTYKDGKENMTATHVHCPVASSGVSDTSGKGECARSEATARARLTVPSPIVLVAIASLTLHLRKFRTVL